MDAEAGEAAAAGVGLAALQVGIDDNCIDINNVLPFQVLITTAGAGAGAGVAAATQGK